MVVNKLKSEPIDPWKKEAYHFSQFNFSQFNFGRFDFGGFDFGGFDFGQFDFVGFHSIFVVCLECAKSTCSGKFDKYSTALGMALSIVSKNIVGRMEKLLHTLALLG